MSGGEEEYEVEAILEAKVEKAQGKSKNSKLSWKYRVRWKGYSVGDDTWEPIESFQGSEHMISAFWERANIGGRNVNDMTQFKAGEVFIPVGPPPRKKRKRMSSTPEGVSIPDLTAGSLQPGPSEYHTRDASHEDSRPVKRPREEERQKSPPLPPSSLPSSATRPTRLQGRRQPSPEVIPDSDEETDRIQTYLSPTRHQKAAIPEPFKVDEVSDTEEPFDPLFDEPKTKVPEHISRRVNPLVKMVDAGRMNLEGAIEAKVRAVREPNVGPSGQSSRAKPGPGRSSGGLLVRQSIKSSLLTAEKGAAKIIKGNYRKEDVVLKDQKFRSKILPTVEPFPTDKEEDSPKPPPSGDELLQLAGLNQTATDLADFDDDHKPDDSVPTDNNSTTEVVAQPAQNLLDLAGATNSSTFGTGRTFPQHGLSSVPTPPSVFGKMQSWNQSTIFGPLSLGSDSLFKLQQQESRRIFLNLDSAVSIPAVFVNATSSNSLMPPPVGASKGTPGKFYDKEATLTLLSTLRTSGLAAHVIVDESATDGEKEHFRHFSARLQIGDIFVAVAGVHILIFCSSENDLISQRLNISPAFKNVPNGILVSKVDIENYSGYADATSQADERRWIQYIATLS